MGTGTETVIGAGKLAEAGRGTEPGKRSGTGMGTGTGTGAGAEAVTVPTNLI